MGKWLGGILKILLCILLVMYAESYFFEGLSLIGINASNLSYFIKELLILILYILISLLIWKIYHEDLQGDGKRYRRNVFPNILMSIVFFVVLTGILAVTGYLCDVTAKSFRINYSGLSHLNIFNDQLDIYLIFLIIKEIILIPFIKTTVFVLGINELFYSKKTGMLCSGLFAALAVGISMSGSLLYILFNVIPYFVLYFTLAYIYRKNNNNIWYSIITFCLYALLAQVLLSKIL